MAFVTLHDIFQFLFVALTIAALPATIVFALIIRRTRDELWRLVAWILWLLYSVALWSICLPQTRRTNDPTGEGLIIVFLLRWGPFLAAGWLALQHWLAARENKCRGFPVRTATTGDTRPEPPTDERVHGV